VSDPRRRRDRERGVRPAGDAVAALAEALQPRTALAEVQRAWPHAVGEAVAAQAVPTAERGGVLTVSCSSAVWAQELDLMAVDVLAQLNGALAAAGSAVRVTALRCQAAPPRRRR
jgi:predicted nucleic acid-binding Zn ribbon protein